MAEENMNTKGTTVETVSDVPKGTETYTPYADTEKGIAEAPIAPKVVNTIEPTKMEAPIASPAPIAPKPVIPTITTSSKPSTIEQQYLDSRQKEITPITPIAQQAPIEAPEIVDVKAPTIVEPPKLTFDETEKQAAEIRDEEIKRALEQESVDQQNIKNAYSHLLAQGKDSGFINARNMSAVRNAALQRYNVVSGSEMRFAQNMMDLSKEQARNNFAFDKEQYEEQVTTHNNVISDLISNGELEAAAEYADALGDSYNGRFKWVNNPTWYNSAKKLQDENIKAEIEGKGGVLDQMRGIALSAKGLDTAHGISRIKDLMTTNADYLGTFVIDTFGSIPKDEYEEHGIDATEAQIVERFLNREIDLNDEAVKDIFANALVHQQQKMLSDQEIEKEFGPYAERYSNDPYMAPVMEAIINANKDGSGSLEIGDGQISTYGLTIDGRNMENAFGIDNKVKNWDDELYGPNNPRNESSLDEPVGEDGSVLNEFSQGDLNEMYDEYHKKMSKKYKSLTTDVQRSEFREGLLNMAGFRDKLERELAKEGVNANNVADIMISGISFEESIGGTAEDKLSELAGGEPIEYLNKEAADDLADTLSKGETPSRYMIESIPREDLIKLAEGGAFASDKTMDFTTDNFGNMYTTRAGNSILDAKDNKDDNMFTGVGMTQLLEKLDSSNKAVVMIGNEPYNVSAEPHYWRKEGDVAGGMPTVKWTIFPVGGDPDDTGRIIYGEITNENGDAIRTAHAKKYAEEAIKKGTLRDVIDPFGHNVITTPQ